MGAQRNGLLRPRCIGTVRARTQMQIIQSTNLAVYDDVCFDTYKIFVTNFRLDFGWEPNNFAKHNQEVLNSQRSALSRWIILRMNSEVSEQQGVE